MKILITRSLEDNSLIRAVAQGHELIAQSLIDITPIPFDAPAADWIFFYSRNGVQHFFEQGNYELIPYKWACMSSGTAERLSEYVLDEPFVGDGDPMSVAKSFTEVRSFEEQVCFVRAQQSMDSVRKLIDHPSDFSLAVYDNKPIDPVQQIDADIILATSPLNFKTWARANTYRNQPIIAIGHTTATAIREILPEGEIVIAKQASIASMADELKAMLQRT